MIKRFLASFFVFIFCLSTWADGLFGPEWTFTNQGLISSYRARVSGGGFTSSRTRWLEEIKKSCPSCRVYKAEGSFYPRIEFSLKDGTRTWFEIQTDPLVLEINAKPMTSKQFSENKDLFQKLVWDTAARVGLKPHNRLVGGHIHLDLETHFRGDQLLQRNFIVDLFNHPRLFMGALSLDYLNAPPLATLGEATIEGFRDTLKRFDRREIDIQKLKVELIEVYEWGNSIMELPKYQALNVDHEKTLEIRGFQPQKSAEHYLAMIRLFEKRIEYLKRFNFPIPLTVKNYEGVYTYQEKNELHRYRTKMPMADIADSYRKFVQEMGLSWMTYSKYIANTRLRNKVALQVRCEGLF